MSVLVPLTKGSYLGGWDRRKYNVLSVLNKGSYGIVYAARNSRTLHKVAIKQISKDTQTTELEILTKLRKANSRNVIKLIDSFSDGQSSYIVNDFCSLGDLYEVIAAQRVPTDVDTIRDLVLQLITAVEACHSVGVYHRDVKPENIFLTIEEAKATTNGDGQVVLKLGDFGLATTEDFSYEVGTGSDRYMAPEQFSADESGGYAPALSDIWSLGIVILNTLFSRNPWKTPTEDDAIYRDFVLDPRSLFEHFTDLTEDTFSVVKHAILRDPSKRSLANMRLAVMEVQEWFIETDSQQSTNMSRRNSTNLADYDTVGPTAGRVPLRTPSLSAKSFEPALASSFKWKTPLPAMPENFRNGLGFAKPARKHSSTLSSSWRKEPPKGINSFDSGLGTSLSSIQFHKTMPRPIRPPVDLPYYAASAPAARPKFAQPSVNKTPFKFGMSWADEDEFDSDDDFSEPTWSDNSAASTIPEQAEDEGSGSTHSIDEGDLFAFESAP